MHKTIEQVMRRVMHLYWRFARGLTLGVRGLVIDEARRIFLVQHTYVRGWHLPGGGVEPGETLATAVARELIEEGNIEVTEPPRLHGMFFDPRFSRRDHIACFVVRARFRQERAASHPTTRDRRRRASSRSTNCPGGTGAGSRARIAEVHAWRAGERSRRW